jgi:hypothetical protein
MTTDVDADLAIAELEQAWGPAGYDAFGFDFAGKQWSAIGSAGDVFVGDTADALAQKLQAHWQAMQ